MQTHELAVKWYDVRRGKRIARQAGDRKIDTPSRSIGETLELLVRASV